MRGYPGFPILLALTAALTLCGCGNKGPLVAPDQKPSATRSPVPASQHGAKIGDESGTAAIRLKDGSRSAVVETNP